MDARARLGEYSQELERTVKQRTAELSAANQELEAFNYTVAHDLRAPLRNMRSLLAIFGEVSPAPNAPQAELLQRLTKSAERMNQLVQVLLDFSRVGKQELRREPTAMDELLSQSMAELEAETQGRQIEWKIEPLPALDCDRGLMQQALINLLANALKFTRPRTLAKIEVGSLPGEGTVTVYVRDNGIGFSMEQADQLFSPFHRLHPERRFEGTGIGLAPVARIIRRHGGRIWAESKRDEGATFYFTLEEGSRGSKVQPSKILTPVTERL